MWTGITLLFISSPASVDPWIQTYLKMKNTISLHTCGYKVYQHSTVMGLLDICNLKIVDKKVISWLKWMYILNWSIFI